MIRHRWARGVLVADDAVAEPHGSRLAIAAKTSTPPQSDNAWNLATLGVHPDSQGAGLGGAMMQAGLDAVDESGTGDVSVAVETSDERTVRLKDPSLHP